jgi:8-oxo-dGTP pyrophosphatase MutT (NUDIX family)
MPDASTLRLPISLKAAIVDGGRVCLLLNERDQWELPGGRLEAAETLAAGLAREVQEELGLVVRVGRLVDGWVFDGVPGKEVLVLVFTAGLAEPGTPRLSQEHRAYRWCGPAELPGLSLPPNFSIVLQELLRPPG